MTIICIIELCKQNSATDWITAISTFLAFSTAFLVFRVELEKSRLKIKPEFVLSEVITEKKDGSTTKRRIVLKNIASIALNIETVFGGTVRKVDEKNNEHIIASKTYANASEPYFLVLTNSDNFQLEYNDMNGNLYVQNFFIERKEDQTIKNLKIETPAISYFDFFAKYNPFKKRTLDTTTAKQEFKNDTKTKRDD